MEAIKNLRLVEAARSEAHNLVAQCENPAGLSRDFHLLPPSRSSQ